MTRKVDVAIIGAGSAGLYALGQVRKVTDRFVLINGGELGTTCARVGCMPSKAAVQVGEDFARRNHLDRYGVENTEALTLDQVEAMEHVRDLRDIFVDRVLSNSTDNLDDQYLIEGFARFLAPNRLQVGDEEIEADRVVIATGSRPFIPPEWRDLDDRILTTDSLFEQESLPGSLAVLGLGVVGLELGQALARMGVDVTAVEASDAIGGIDDPVVNALAQELYAKDMPLWLGEHPQVKTHAEGVEVRCGDKSVVVEKLLVAVGRVPNVNGLGLEALDVPLDARGIPSFDPHTMRLGDLPIYLAGDVTGDLPILHEAGDEGRIAGFNAVHAPALAFQRKTPLTIVFADPNLVRVGKTLGELDQEQLVVGEIRLGPVGRALIMGKNHGIIRVYVDRRDGRILGGTLLCAKGEHLGHLLAWSIQLDLSVYDLLKMPFYHPTLEEALQAALYDALRQLETPPALPVELEAMDDPTTLPKAAF